MTEEADKALKALRAAVRKAERAGVAVKITVVIQNEDRSTTTLRLDKE